MAKLDVLYNFACLAKIVTSTIYSHFEIPIKPLKASNSSILSFKPLLFECFKKRKFSKKNEKIRKKTKSFEKKRKNSKITENFRKKTKKFEKKRKSPKKNEKKRKKTKTITFRELLLYTRVYI
jgi:hypothetical protein